MERSSRRYKWEVGVGDNYYPRVAEYSEDECEERDVRGRKRARKSVDKAPEGRNTFYLIPFVILFACVVYVFLRFWWGGFDLDGELSRLKDKYPEQNQDLWRRVRGMLTLESPAAETLMFLHGENDVTARCLAEDIAKVIGRKYSVEEPLFVYRGANGSAEDKTLLSHYQDMIKKWKYLIVPQLNKIPGDEAMIFHYLCDEFLKPVKPSFFIFTVENATKNVGKKFTNIKTITGTILRESWKELGDATNPLITRVAKYIFSVVPQSRSNCS